MCQWFFQESMATGKGANVGKLMAQGGMSRVGEYLFTPHLWKPSKQAVKTHRAEASFVHGWPEKNVATHSNYQKGTKWHQRLFQQVKGFKYAARSLTAAETLKAEFNELFPEQGQ